MARRGTSQQADLVTRTRDGEDLNTLWADYSALLAEWNKARNAFVSFLTFPVFTPLETVVLPGEVDFERASEYGLATTVRPKLSKMAVGYGYEWYDRRQGWTARYLAGVDSRQLDAEVDAIIAADQTNVFNQLMRLLFTKENEEVIEDGVVTPYEVTKFWNGDGKIPPSYAGVSFDGTHNHYLVSGSATLDSGDLDASIEHLAHHGYTAANGYRMVVVMNRAEVLLASQWRKGEATAGNNNVAPLADFIPAQGSQAFILEDGQTVVGGQPAGTLNGLNVVGQYRDALIVENDLMPEKYLLTFVTGGEDSLSNPIGYRQHEDPAWRGLVLQGGSNNYPLVESTFGHGFGFGVRHRGAGVLMKVGTGEWTPPARYSIGS